MLNIVLSTVVLVSGACQVDQPDVVRHMIKHGLMCKQDKGNFAVVDRNGGPVPVVNKNSGKRYPSSVVNCSDTDSVEFYMEDGKLHVDMVGDNGTEGTYVFEDQ